MLWVFYDDLHADLPGCIARVAEFLGLSESEPATLEAEDALMYPNQHSSCLLLPQPLHSCSCGKRPRQEQRELRPEPPRASHRSGWGCTRQALQRDTYSPPS